MEREKREGEGEIEKREMINKDTYMSIFRQLLFIK